MKTSTDWLNDKAMHAADIAGDDDVSLRTTHDWIRRIQADARASALEEAAASCEVDASTYGFDAIDHACYRACVDCAEEIRALKTLSSAEPLTSGEVSTGTNSAKEPGQ